MKNKIAKIIISTFICFLSCKKLETTKADYEKDKIELITNSKINPSQVKLFLTFNSGISQEEYNKTSEDLINNKKLFRNDISTFILLPSNERIDTFFISAYIYNNKLESIKCSSYETKELNSNNELFFNLKNSLNEKYGQPNASFIDNSKSYEFMGSTYYPFKNSFYFWMTKDGKYITLEETRYPENNNKSESVTTSIQYSTLNYEKYLIMLEQENKNIEDFNRYEEMINKSKNDSILKSVL